MKLVETILTEGRLHMRYANDADATKATEWVEFSVTIERTEDPFLSEIEAAALARVRALVTSEIRAREALADARR